MSKYGESCLVELKESIKNIIARYVTLPSDFKIGIWIFWHNPNKEQLETLDFIGIDGKIIDQHSPLYEDLYKKTFIRKGIGSIGYAALTENPIYIENTFSDPRGTVLQLDRKIGQKCALCIPIREDVPNGELIILDIFSSDEFEKEPGDLTSCQAKIKEDISKLPTLNYIFDELAHLKIQRQKELYEAPRQKPGVDANEVYWLAANSLVETFRLYIELLGIGIRYINGEGEDIRVQYLINMGVLRPHLESKLNWCSLNGKRCSQCDYNGCLFKIIPLDCVEIDKRDAGNRLSVHATVFLKSGLSDADKTAYCDRITEGLDGYLGGISLEQKQHMMSYLENSSDILRRKEFVEPLRSDLENRSDLIKKKEFIEPLSSGNSAMKRGFEDNEAVAFLSLNLGLTHSQPRKYILRMVDSTEKEICEPEYIFMHPSSFMPIIWGANFIDDAREYIASYPPTFMARGFDWGIESGLYKGSDKIEISHGTRRIGIVLEQNQEEHLFSYAWLPNNNYFCDIINSSIGYGSTTTERSDKIAALLGLESGLVMPTVVPIEHRGLASLVPEQVSLELFVPRKIQEQDIEFLRQVAKNILQLKTSQLLNIGLHESVVRTAITTIMSRNMSHNLGSHILNALAEESVSSADDRYLFRYLQHRMDYIAQIATEIPKWSCSMWLLHDIMLGFYSQKHVQEYIAKAENLRAHVRSILREPQLRGTAGMFGTRDYPITIEVYELKNGKKDVFVSQDVAGGTGSTLVELRDIQVAVPGGVVGAHAFYTVLENIIRNSAKHNHDKLSSAGGLKISIQVEKMNDNIILTIYDNVSDIFGNIDDQDAEKMREYIGASLPPADIQNELSFRQKNGLLHWRINKALRAPLIDRMGKIQQENWGIAEIRISAGFLNRCDYSQIGDGKRCYFDEVRDLGFIRAVAIPSDDKKDFFLGYRLRIAAPKEILLIAESFDFDKNAARNNGIYSENRLPDYGADFDFVLMDHEKWQEYIDKGNRQLLLPCRVLRMEDGTESRLVANGKYEEIKKNVYSRWLGQILKGAKISLDVTFNNSVEDGRVNRESQFVNTFIKDHFDCLSHDYQELVSYMFPMTNGAIPELKTDIRERVTWESEYSDIRDFCIQSGLEGIQLFLLNKLLIYLYNVWSNHNYPPERPGTVPEILCKDFNLEDGNNQTDSILEKYFHEYVDCGSESTAISYCRHLGVGNINAGAREGNDSYQEGLSGSQVLYNLIVMDLMNNDIRGARTVMNLIENGIFRVAILDERIIRFCISSKDVLSRYSGMKINVMEAIKWKDRNYEFDKEPIHENSGVNGGIYFRLLTEQHSVYKLGSGYKPDIFIIHQGILDKMGVGKREDGEQFIKAVYEEVKYCYVTTGRGEPTNMPSNARYIPFSSLETALMKAYPEKLMLMQTLMKAIGRGNG